VISSVLFECFLNDFLQLKIHSFDVKPKSFGFGVDENDSLVLTFLCSFKGDVLFLLVDKSVVLVKLGCHFALLSSLYFLTISQYFGSDSMSSGCSLFALFKGSNMLSYFSEQ
jgi:hypothetical protein